jgi:hypothetical protein
MAFSDKEPSFAEKERMEFPEQDKPPHRKGPLGWLARFFKDLIVRGTSTK